MADEEDVNLFSGAGGTSVGLRRAGIDALGIDWWDRACETHEKNGHRTLRADLATIDWAPWVGRVRLMWASPPCQPWSAAGDQEGEFDERDGIPWWLRAVEEVEPRVIVMENVRGLTFEKHRPYLSGMLASLRTLGYRIDFRVLDAADYGVPQNRERFILIGRRDGGALIWPTVTHTEGGGLFTQPWLSMAQALGWGIDRPYLTVAPGTKSGGADPAFVGGSGARKSISQWNLRTDQRSGAGGATTYVARPIIARPLDEPANTIDSGAVRNWCWERPSTTVAGDPRIMRPGRHDPNVSGSQMKDAIRVEVWEAAVLQGFPADYVFCGNRTEQATQVGNAVPPPLAEAIVRALLPT